MTAIWERAVLGDEDAPGSIALVIGVGAYGRQVVGGVAPLAEPLSPAARSAEAVLGWLFEARDQLDPPLRAVYAAISDPREGGGRSSVETPDGPREVPPPTIRELQALVDDWYDRLDRSPDNAALFYACGHGILTHQPYLLAEDYGARRRDAFANLIALEDFVNFMATCRAGTQLFLADCCQEFQEDAFGDLNDIKGEHFGSAPHKRILEPKRTFIRAATPGALARAEQHGMTLFARALLAALAGDAARKGPDGRWRVSFSSLAQAIPLAAERFDPDPLRPAVAYNYGRPPEFLRLEGPPEVRVEVLTDPSEALSHGRMTVWDFTGAKKCSVDRPWHPVLRATLTAAAGYTAKAEFDGGPYANGEEPFQAEPLMPPVIVPTPLRPGPGGP